MNESLNRQTDWWTDWLTRYSCRTKMTGRSQFVAALNCMETPENLTTPPLPLSPITLQTSHDHSPSPPSHYTHHMTTPPLPHHTTHTSHDHSHSPHQTTHTSHDHSHRQSSHTWPEYEITGNKRIWNIYHTLQYRTFLYLAGSILLLSTYSIIHNKYYCECHNFAVFI